jgi:antitoxin component YwqK of YwqJK toxin-antitoxin module
MIKRDKIFYWACGIFSVGAIFAALDNNLALLFFVGAYLLRPILHAFDLAEGFADERQVQIHSRSGNIAFIAIMLAMVAFAISHYAHGEQPEELLSLIGIGIGARAITGLLMGGEYRKAASIIIIVVGSAVALFVFISEGFSTAPLFVGGLALVFASFGVIAFKYPRIISATLTIAAASLIYILKLYEFQARNLAMWMIVVCFLIAALCLYRGQQSEFNESPIRSKHKRVIALSAGSAVLLVFFIFIGFKHKEETGNKPGETFSSSQTITGETDIQGVACTGRIEYYPNGKLKSCVLAREDTLSGQFLEGGTVVAFNNDGLLDWCFLQKDTEIQGILTKGESHGFMTGFYPNGKLKMAWPAKDQMIKGIPVKEWSFWSDAFGGGAGTFFWENGNLKRCKLGKDFIIDEHNFKKGDVVNFDESGKLVLKK